MSTTLQDLITKSVLRSYAGDRSYDRGRDYQERVQIQSYAADQLSATVEGEYFYDVNVNVNYRNRLAYDCNCPYGVEGNFCKHLVATCLTWLEMDKDPALAAESELSAFLPEVRIYLGTLTHTALMIWLKRALLQGEAVYKEIRKQARIKAEFSDAALLGLFREVVELFHLEDSYDYLNTCIENLNELMAVLEGRLALNSTSFLNTIEAVIDYLAPIAGYFDSSQTGLRYSYLRLYALHAETCARIRPNPLELANWVFKIEFNEQVYFDLFKADDYLEALGAIGFQEYQRLVWMAWNEAQGPLFPYSRRDRWLQLRQEQLARQNNKSDILIEVLSKDLTNPNQYLKIAQICKNEGLADQAMDWAKKGLQAFPTRRDILDEFMLHREIEQGNRPNAAEIAWNTFVRNHYDYSACRQLLQKGEQLGNRDELKLKMLELLKLETKPLKVKGKKQFAPDPRHLTLLILVHLREGDLETAWNLFSGGETFSYIWKEMAVSREPINPDQAVGVYQDLLDGAMERGRSTFDYNEAFSWVETIKRVRYFNNQQQLFATELAAITAKWKTRRNFTKLLAGLVL